MSSFEISSPPTCRRDEIRSFYDYWLSIHPATGLPGRQHFDPLEIPRLLANIWLLDVFREPYRFRVRLVGTAITDFTGRDVTGQWCHDVYDNFEDTDGFSCIRACAVNGKPQYRMGNVISNLERSYTAAERIYLPLASNGRDVDIIAVMTQYLDR